MINETIPIVTLEIFEEVYIDNLLDIYRITKKELEFKVSGDNQLSLNKRAERYINTYLMNKASEILKNDNWLTLKELYIQWKLFEEIELEEVSKDKKESLLELLELFKDILIKDGGTLPGSKKITGITVFGG